MKQKTIVIKICLIAILFPLITCGSSQGVQREGRILSRYSTAKKIRYSDLLVSLDQYTTNGEYYHKKYYRYLIGLAGDIIENKNLVVKKGSIGFYFDKRAGLKNRLYLGLDIDLHSEFSGSYGETGVRILRNYLRDVIDTVNSCGTIFAEKEIIGMVIGWKWRRDGNDENMSIWIVEKDVIRFEEGRLTLDELIQGSSITNTRGRVLILPL